MCDYRRLNDVQSEAETDSFTRSRYRQMAKYVGTVGRILDVGCSTGRGGPVLKEMNSTWSVVGLDCLQRRLQHLPVNTYSGAICGLTTDIALADSSVDAIVAGEFIEHLKPDDVDKSLLEFYRILVPGGRCVLTTPNPRYLRLRFGGRSVLGGAHLSQHEAQALAARLRKSGFENTRLRGSGRVSRLVGEWFPWLAVYGSYLLCAEKPRAVRRDSGRNVGCGGRRLQ